jgi:hypothetical protein
MRRSLAAQTGLAVLLWFFAAPFLHLHAADSDDHDHEEAGHSHRAIVHFHMPDHHATGQGSALSAPDEDEKPLDSFAIVQKHASFSLLIFPCVLRIETWQASLDWRGEVAIPSIPRAHDPPALETTNPRAPPA